MKLFSVLVFTLISFVGFSQINSFSKTTQILDKPNGKSVFEVNSGVEYWYYDHGNEDACAEIEEPCFILKSALNNSIVEKGSFLFDFQGKVIGTVLFNTKCNTKPNTFGYYKSVPDSMYYIWLTGFIEKEMLSKNVNLSEIMKNNKGLCDSSISISRAFTFNNTAGEEQTVQEDNSTYYALLNNGKSTKKVRVNEKRTTLTQFGADGDFKSMIVEIIQDYDTDHPQSFYISNEAYKCDFNYNRIVFYEYNWSAGPEERYLYSVSTFKQLMNFHGDLYSVRIPESETTGFIGYLPNPDEWDSTYYGNLCFATPEKVLINKKIICRNKKLVDSLTCFDAKIKFVPLNKSDAVSKYDSTTFLLNSKWGGKIDIFLTDFRIIMYLDYDGENIPLELEFRDGDVFIVKNYKDAFELQ